VFKLIPSGSSFSRVIADLYFDGQKFDSLPLRIIQGPLASDVLEFSSVLDLTGIEAGRHVLTVDIFELWLSGERITSTSKETTIDYAPVRREDRMIKVPIVKSTAGVELSIVSDSEKRLFSELKEERKKESTYDRDRR
jgi:hypothetical protein